MDNWSRRPKVTVPTYDADQGSVCVGTNKAIYPLARLLKSIVKKQVIR